jgi:hypothetical protein
MSEVERRLAAAVTRRSFLAKSAAAGGTLAMGGVLAACGGGGSTSAATTGGGGTTTAATGGGALGDQLKEILGTPKNLLKEGPGDFKMVGSWALTGQGSIYGKLQSEGFLFGCEQVEAWTDGKLKFQVELTDNKSADPQAEAAGVRKAGLAGTPAFITSYIFGFGAQPALIEQYEMLTLDPGGGTGPIAQGIPFCYGFRASYPEDMIGGLVQTILLENPDVKTWAIVDAEIAPEYNEPNVKSTEEALAKYGGGKLVGHFLAPLGQTDYGSTISEVKDAGADATLFYTFGTDLGYQAREIERQSVSGNFGAIDYTPDGTQIAGPAYNGWYFCIDFLDASEPPNDWSKLFVETFEEEKGEIPEQYNAAYYTAAFAFAQLMERVLESGGNIKEGKDWLKAMEEAPSFPTVYGGEGAEIGKIDLSPKTHSPESIPMLCWKSPGSGETHNIEPLATTNIGGKEFEPIS